VDGMNAIKKDYLFDGASGAAVYGCVYTPKSGPLRGYVQILHDMRDHIERYGEIMNEFAVNGYVCFGHDQLGHGKTAKPNEMLGRFAGQKSDIYLIDDANKMYALIQSEFPITPKASASDSSRGTEIKAPVLHAVIGVGFGAALAKLYIVKYPDVNALVLCGDRGPDIKALFQLARCRLLKGRRGENTVSPEFDKYIEKNYSKYSNDAGSGVDWRTRDARRLEELEGDEYCGFNYTLGAHNTILSIQTMCGGRAWHKTVPPFLAVYIIAGSYDPVGGYNRNLIAMIKKLRRYGAKNIFSKFYDGARHDLFFETNGEQVVADVFKFLDTVINKQLNAEMHIRS